MSRDDSSVEPARPAEVPLQHSGTEVTLQGFDAEWFDDADVGSVTAEIEAHFELLLKRPNLTICVRSRGEKDPARLQERVCSPFDYSDIAGVELMREFTVKGAKTKEGGADVPTVAVRLKVTDREYLRYRPRFFLKGRSVAEVSALESFIKASRWKHALWSHPQIVGYVDVGDALTPVITRDDFQRGVLRTQIYSQVGVLLFECYISTVKSHFFTVKYE